MGIQLLSALTRDPRVIAREEAAGKHLPYARHVDDVTIETHDGLLLQIIRIDGLLFETADTDELNYRTLLRDAMLRTLGSSRFALYHHLIRRRADGLLEGDFPDAFSQALDERWRARLASRQMFVNELYLTIVRRPLAGRMGLVDRLRGLAVRGIERSASIAAEKRALDAARDALVASLNSYGTRVLTVRMDGESPRSEPLWNSCQSFTTLTRSASYCPMVTWGIIYPVVGSVSDSRHSSFLPRLCKRAALAR